MENNKIDVLVVDDNKFQLDFLKHLLEYNKLKCHLTDQSIDAYDTIIKINPRLIILDIMMPNLDGMTLLKKIRENKKLTSIPVIIHSNKTFQVDQKKALALGANAFISKPSKGAVLIEEIQKHI